ncbi:hypothetical protein BO94DRAFT_232352 [Aspergillus sclerotioniger CBS 115572]|uniref:Uncharacterized protein n=1 Tax=Aspergillus sclerotioniger CBS 115572 TaxID=1450535 RepID=A0A317VHB8_9EURO|nr:hypothetical protein BO94DRAFT_232352 [Aspergillus sclerotioniger CBS 115572]PWY73754.1 hypothetical protein BO94DRAFT_232352 [Aspergillus sclerotioniger CBS 115572]
MPGLEIVNTSLASPAHLDPPQWRAHKSLRRRPNVLWCPPVIDTTPGGRHGRPSNGASSAATPVRPLTPPGVASSEDLSSSSTGTITPKPSHPPTPESTPPRLAVPVSRPGLSHFALSSSSSSRAESFQTAYEMISDAETETPHRSPPSLPTRQKSLRTDGPLEYGDRSGESTPVPDPRTNRLPTSMMEPPVHRRMEVDADRKVSPPRRQKSTRDGAPRIMRIADPSEQRYDINGIDAQSVRSSLREPIRDPQEPVGGLSIEQFREEIGWPRPEDRPLATEQDDTRRLSDVSTSTVEVMIIDSLQSTQRSLRHTDKRGSLRSAPSPHPKSDHLSLASTESQHRLVHKAGRITESDRKSIASEISFSGTSSLNVPPQNVDVVPVVVIPERRSSLKSTSTSRETSQSRSRHSSRRGPSASRSRPGSREPAHRKRPSDTNVSIGKGAEPRGRHSGRPTIPPRGSSLSAPTSRNNSRTTSLTSESLRDHALATEQPGTQDRAPEPPLHRPETLAREDLHDAAEESKTQSIIIGVEDMSHLRPPSMPYTQISIPSSSPGLIEVSEARTVIFFPHNNESLLLVDPQGQSALHGQAPGVDYPELRQPRIDDSPTLRYEMTSPLKNPRQPPKPPVCQVVPPTPVQDNDRPQGKTNSPTEPSKRPGRRFGPGRRPWMGRSRSDSFNSFVRSLSLTSVKNRKAGKDVDGRLQSFWRPRRFWDDSEAEDSPRSPAQNPEAEAEADLVIKNSLGMPQQRVVFEGPSLRSPDTRRRLFFDHAARPQPNRNTLVGNSQVFTPEAFCSQTSLHHPRFRSLSWWRLRFRPGGKIRNLRKRVRRTWQRHAEHRREAKREKLKQSIGGAVLVESSTQLKITE